MESGGEASTELSSLEELILADDEVTHAEMERVFLALLDCFESAGIPVADSEFRPADGWSYDLAVASEESLAQVERCEDDILEPIGDIYLAAHQETPQERAALLESLRTCLMERGFTNVPAGPPSAMREAVHVEDYLACVLELSDS